MRRNTTKRSKLLDATHPDAFAGLFADLKGDAYVAQGKTAEAQRSLQTGAGEAACGKAPIAPIVQVKLDGLGGDK